MQYFSDYYGSFGNLGLYGALVGYGTINLTQTSPPQSFTEVLSLAEMKAWLKVPLRSPTDPDEDAGLIALIIAARMQAEISQGRDLVPKQYDLSFDYWTGYHLEIGAPLVSIDLFQYKNYQGLVTTMAENTDYVVDKAKRPAIVAPPYNTIWPIFTPWPSSAILIRFTSGFTAADAFWSECGAMVKQGMRVLISEWWNRRLPLETGIDALNAYPMGLRVSLGAGSIPRAR